MFWIVWCSVFFSFSGTSAVYNFSMGKVGTGFIQVALAFLFLAFLVFYLGLHERKRQLELSLARRGIR